ncbi:uncharacterized protein LOC129572297 [Sitodiplosis mosellana]|uniref:uncharacterized protein LOC129572297 n=1 Tax=Sitodiplosis mosellana TaxID=263140 RepID=UPI0024446BA6|nr:uncharacterized protein LOC129572297 [Sitodiplosis mosellana]
MPQPTKTKEEDELSATIPFLLRENQDRYYPKSDVTIRESIVDTLLLWNRMPLYNNKENDFMFVQFMLIDVFGGVQLSTCDLSAHQTKLRFVKELLAIRVKDDVLRMKNFDAYATRIMQQFKEKSELDK